MPIDLTTHPAAIDPEHLLLECDVRTGKAGGPGGQHRNTTDTAVEMHHRPTGTTSTANERRSQLENRHKAIFRLRLNLAVEVRRTPVAGAPPSELWRSRCRDGRISVNPEHRDFPAILAEALDHLAAVDADPKRAAAWLGCSMSQLIKLLKDEPRALAWLNQKRQQRGLHEMH